MRHRESQRRLFEWLCACLIVTPCAVLAQQAPTTPQSPAPSATSSGAAHANSTPQNSADDPEPAVDTSAGVSDSSERAPQPQGAGAAENAKPDAARAQAEHGHDAKQKPGARAPGKSMDHLELGTTDITGNRELPKVMYIVPWKRSDLGDLTGKPLNSLVDQTLEPVDRNVFERSNRYYGAVTAGASQDVHRTPDAGSAPAGRDEK